MDSASTGSGDLSYEGQRSKAELSRQNATVGDAFADEAGEGLYDVPDSTVDTEPIGETLLASVAPMQPAPVAVVEPLVHNIPIEETRVRFRLQAKFLFLTWPQCSTPKETVMERIKLLPNYEYCVVCREDHKDGSGEHLHAFVALTKMVRTWGTKWLDDLAGKFGNYSPARNNKKSVQYVIKDGDYIFDGFDPVAFLSLRQRHKSTRSSIGDKKMSKAQEIALLVKNDGATADIIDDLDPGYMMGNKRKIEEYISWQKLKRMCAEKLPWTPLNLSLFTDRDFNFKIAKWVALNIKQPREFKQKQLYIWSDGPNAGKTHLINELSKYLVVYNIPKTNFVDGYESGRFDLVVCDEFKAHFTIQFLNEFLQGSNMHLNQKGTGHLKTDNPPMIFLSNLSLEECYCKKAGTGPFLALLSRFKVVKVPFGKKIDLFWTLNKPNCDVLLQ